MACLVKHGHSKAKHASPCLYSGKPGTPKSNEEKKRLGQKKILGARVRYVQNRCKMPKHCQSLHDLMSKGEHMHNTCSRELPQIHMIHDWNRFGSCQIEHVNSISGLVYVCLCPFVPVRVCLHLGLSMSADALLKGLQYNLWDLLEISLSIAP